MGSKNNLNIRDRRTNSLGRKEGRQEGREGGREGRKEGRKGGREGGKEGRREDPLQNYHFFDHHHPC